MKKQAFLTILLVILFGGLIILASSVNFDLNHDGIVNIMDLQLLASHFQGKAAYNSSYDFNNNGKVDLFDLVKVARSMDMTNGTTGESPEILWQSTWNYSTGNSATAVEDGGKWGYTTGAGWPDNRIEVIPDPTGLAPTPNVLYNNMSTGSGSGVYAGTVETEAAWPLILEGETLYRSVYVYFDFPSAAGNLGAPGFHPLSDASHHGPTQSESDGLAAWTFGVYANGEINPNFGVYRSSVYSDQAWRSIVNLNQRQWYRLAWGIKVINATVPIIEAHVRIYNLSNAIVIDSGDFYAVNGNTSRTLADNISINASVITSKTAYLQAYTIGNNGPNDQGATGWNLLYQYPGARVLWADATVCRYDWCSPHNNGV